MLSRISITSATASSRTLRVNVRSWRSMKVRASCWVSVLAPWRQTMRAQVGDRRLDHPYRVESRMIVEIAILGREQAAHQVRRKIVQLDFRPARAARPGSRRPMTSGSISGRGQRRAERVGHALNPGAGERQMNQRGRALAYPFVKAAQVDRHAARHERVPEPGERGRGVRRRHPGQLPTEHCHPNRDHVYKYNTNSPSTPAIPRAWRCWREQPWRSPTS